MLFVYLCRCLFVYFFICSRKHLFVKLFGYSFAIESAKDERDVGVERGKRGGPHMLIALHTNHF